MSGCASRCALYSGAASWRNVFSFRSNTTMTPSGLWSFINVNSIEQNPYTELVTCPLAVVMSVGNAKKARYASELPSRTINCIEKSPGSCHDDNRQLRSDLSVQNLIGHIHHLGSRRHCILLDVIKGGLLGHGVLIDQQTFCPIQKLSQFKLLP